MTSQFKLVTCECCIHCALNWVHAQNRTFSNVKWKSAGTLAHGKEINTGWLMVKEMYEVLLVRVVKCRACCSARRVFVRVGFRLKQLKIAAQ